jgi:biotin carboxyl carrier protein
MKLKVELAGRAHDVSLKLVKDKATADIEGRHYELEVRQLGDAQYLLINKSDVYNCRVEGNRGASNFFGVGLRGHSYNIKVVDPKRLRSGQTSGAHDHGTAQIVSPMPGKVVRVLVAEGQPVEAGAGIIVVEAMKMQNEMKAPKAGVVISINAEPGATVNAGDVLAVIE